ncbi:DUF885 domain-containing protein [Paucibacter sediminis]|uniref:DUF885 domain-containing protein n=1 Tax=Paucibacter sediminis TaxID=3019553 RepID=A0AA95NJ98_9BURK|nr:DUF885 domain-containing protein [Paucibacter sp. S2-9]WIT13368.1 DUF885 domain-containing protein [Paucibacter sp. S2-9]
MTTHTTRRLPMLTRCALASLLTLGAWLPVPALAAAAPPAAKLQQTRQVPAAFDAEVDAFLKAYWALLPEAAVAAGEYAAAARLPAPTAANRQAQLRFSEAWLQRLARLDRARLTPAQQGDLALLQNHLRGSIWSLREFRSWQWDPSEYNVAGAFGELLNKDFAPLPRRLALIERRLQQVPAYYRAALAQLQEPSPEHLRLAIQQSEGALATFATEIPQALQQAQQQAQLPAAAAQRLARHNAAAERALQAYIAALKALDARQTAAGTGRSFRIGQAAFEAKFGYDIQAGVDARGLYERALQHKEALHQRMSELSDRLWPGLFGDAAKPAERLDKIARVIEKLSANHVSPAGYVDEIKAQIPALAKFVEQHDLLALDPTRPLQVRETPAYMRGVAGASISAPGPLDPQGATYYNVDPLDKYTPAEAESYLREYNHWVLQILSIHEAIPGHYLQLLHANKSPSKVKALFGNGAMVEGWAVYGERMMMEAGWGDMDGQPSPEMWLMYSKWNLRTVCNAILDYRTHVLGQGQAEAEALLEREAFQSKTEASEKWHRAQVTAVQLSSYFAGYSEIMALREQLKAQRGAAFSLKDFHTEFLSHGSAPVKMVSELMQQQGKRR